jgi:hypothetical protein
MSRIEKKNKCLKVNLFSTMAILTVVSSVDHRLFAMDVHKGLGERRLRKSLVNFGDSSCSGSPRGFAEHSLSSSLGIRVKRPNRLVRVGLQSSQLRAEPESVCKRRNSLSHIDKHLLAIQGGMVSGEEILLSHSERMCLLENLRGKMLHWFENPDLLNPVVVSFLTPILLEEESLQRWHQIIAGISSLSVVSEIDNVEAKVVEPIFDSPIDQAHWQLVREAFRSLSPTRFSHDLVAITKYIIVGQLKYGLKFLNYFFRYVTEYRDSNGTLLHDAVKNSRATHLSFLSQMGADMSALDSYGISARAWARACGTPEVKEWFDRNSSL